MRAKVYLLSILLLTTLPTSVYAFGSFGVRVGTGLSFVELENDLPSGVDEPEVSPFALGVSYQINLPMVEIEANALWWRNASTVGSAEIQSSYIALPVIARASIPLVPALLSLNVGGGLEPRFHLTTSSDDVDVDDSDIKSMVMYLPISIGGTINLQLVSLGLDIRYERQLTDHSELGSDRIHQLMFFGGANF